MNGQIHVVLPNLQELRNIVSRLAPVADDVDVSANHVCSTSLTLALPGYYMDGRYAVAPPPPTNEIPHGGYAQYEKPVPTHDGEDKSGRDSGKGKGKSRKSNAKEE